MPPVNPWAIPRAPRRQETRTFTEPGHEDQPVTLTFEELDILGQTTVRERTRELVVEYVTGQVDAEGNLLRGKDGEPLQEPQKYPLSGAGGGGVRLNETMCASFAMIETLQVGPEAERYPMDLLLGISLHMPTVFADLCRWAQEFLPQVDAPAGNLAAASGPGSSAPPSSGSNSPTPDLSCTPLPA